METTHDKFSEDNIDIKKYLYKALSNWYLFVIGLLVSMAIAVYINRSTVPQYRLSASVMLRQNNNNNIDLGSLGGGGSLSIAQNKPIEGEIALLKSFGLVHKTLQKLDFDIAYYSNGRFKTLDIYSGCPFQVIKTGDVQLYEYPIQVNILNKSEFILKINHKYNFEKKYSFGEEIICPFFKATIILLDTMNTSKSYIGIDYHFTFRNTEMLVNEYISNLQVTGRDKNGLILDLTIDGQNITKQKLFIEQLIAQYIESNLDEKNLMALNTIQFIDQQLGFISDSLKESENEMVDFRRANKMVDISRESEKIYQILEKYEEQRSELTIGMKYYEYLCEFFNNSKTDIKNLVSPSLMGITEPLLTSGISRLQELYSEKMQLISTTRSSNPKVEQIDNTLDATLEVVKANLKNIIERNKVMLADLNERINKYESSLGSIPQTERKYIKIQRNFTLHDNIYNYLLQKRAEAGIMRAANTPDIRILDEPRESKVAQIAPQKSKNYSIAIILGLLIPFAFIFLKDYLNDKITDLGDIEKHTQLPIIGTILHQTDSTIVTTNPRSILAEAFRTMRTNLQYLLNGEDKKSIMVTSSISGEGKTFVTLNLACILAVNEKKTIILSFDLRKPKINQQFDLSNDKGLSTYLIGQTSYEELIQQTTVSNLFIAMSGPIPPNPSELIENKRIKELFKRLRSDFDYIIIDSPPVAIVSDAQLLAKLADINLFIVRHNYTSRNILPLIERFRSKKTMLNMAIVVNDVKLSSRYSYGYYYGYEYGYAYIYGREYYEDSQPPKSFKRRLIDFLNP